ncbi:MAG: branched-chain amino acid ABC transporter permease [Proteobacteria bacterium]|nr:branched-chain amino acid ABC transporter permease [Pseudomonadota bacterium]
MWRPSGTFDTTYRQDMAIIRTPLRWSMVLVCFGALLLVPVFGSYYMVALLNSMAITVILILGLQIVSGYCGQISFGQAAFMAVGAYISAILTTKVGLSFWVALPLTGFLTGIFGLLGGAPSMRIKGFYLAIATIAIHFVTLWLLLHLEITGKSNGLLLEPPRIGDFFFDTDERMFYIIIPIMFLMTFAARNLIRTRVGRAFVAVRDNDLAAQVMGISVFYYKLLAFFISCFFAGVAGCLWAHLNLVCHPEQFTLLNALWYIGMLIVGGMGSIQGVFFGVVFIRLLDELVLLASPSLAVWFPWLGSAPAAALGLTFFGLVLALFLILEPRGLSHRWDIVKASLRLYPFAH